MGIFGLFKKSSPIAKIENEEIVNRKIVGDLYDSFVVGSLIKITGLNKKRNPERLTDVYGEKLDSKASGIVLDYVNKMTGKVFYNLAALDKILDTEFDVDCENGEDTAISPFHLLDREVITITKKYSQKVLMEIECKSHPELSIKDRDELNKIENEIYPKK